MIVFVTFSVGLVIWIVGWALGIKPFDAFLFTSFITLVAAGIQIAKPSRARTLESSAPAQRAR